jgi:uncharacterized protein YndB with AHSA1/START domain
MEKIIKPISVPDITTRPYHLEVERELGLPPEKIYQAWTEKIDVWFAAPGTALLRPAVNEPFFWEVDFEGNRHPHYGRFLELEKDHILELTWVTSGTQGKETILRLELSPTENGTMVKLTHSGFPDLESMKQHEDAWPMVLAQLEQKIRGH